MSGTKLQRATGAPTRYTPFGSTLSREVNEMRERMRRLFQEPFGRLAPEMLSGELPQAVGWTPAVELSESEQEYTLVAELPGMDANDVHVDFADGMLTLRGEKREQGEATDRERRIHVWERSYGSFLRTFEFPSPIDDEKISAAHRDGVLEVHLPKKAGAHPRGRRIAVLPKA